MQSSGMVLRVINANLSKLRFPKIDETLLENQASFHLWYIFLNPSKNIQDYVIAH